MSTMQTWHFPDFGPIEHLAQKTVPIPEPGPGEALVKVRYAALNPADRYLIEGKYPRPGTPPFAVGRDCVGTIEVPGDSGRYNKGDEVVLLRSEIGVQREGTLAQYVTVPEVSLAPKPSGWTGQEAAGAALVHLTAWMALVDDGKLEAGQNVLVTGASGGVGTASVVLAKSLGAKVVALSRSDEKRAKLLELGADAVVDSDSPNLVKEVCAALDGGRCDVIVENLAGPFLQKCFEMANYRGRICVIGLLAGLTSDITIGYLIHKRLQVIGTAVAGYTPEKAQAAWAKIVETLDKAGKRPVVDSTYPFDQALEAFGQMRKGPMGKVLVGPMHGE